MKKDKTDYVELKLCHVYLIAESPSGPTKIGVAGSVSSRLASLQVGNPRKLKTYGARPFLTSEEAFEFERNLHELFSVNCIQGEWFDLAPKDIARKVRNAYGPPSSYEELMERAIATGIVKLPKHLL